MNNYGGGVGGWGWTKSINMFLFVFTHMPHAITGHTEPRQGTPRRKLISGFWADANRDFTS